MMSGRCTGYPRGSCHKYNEYAKATKKGWTCSECKDRKKVQITWFKEWQVDNA